MSTISYRLAIGYKDTVEKDKTLSYSGVKETLTQDEVTEVTKQLLLHGDDIFDGGVSEVVSAKHIKTETTTTDFVPYSDGE